MKNKYALKAPILFVAALLAFPLALFSQNVGIGTAAPVSKLHVQANGAADGVIIDNIATNGDPITQYRVNGTSRITMGVDDSDADKFKIGTTAITTNTRMTIETGGNIGIRTTTPAHLLHMTNGGVTVGGTAMAMYENLGPSGVPITGYNNNAASGYNGVEGLTEYNGTGFIPAGVFGLALYNGTAQAPTIGVRGHTNEWQGTGVRGTRFNGGGPDTGFGAELYDDVGYTGGLFNLSDLRAKKDVEPISDALTIVDQLNPVSYHFNLDKYPNMGLNSGLEYGFVAQEVAQVLPDITQIKRLATNACEEVAPGSLTENKTEEFMMMDYTRIIPILTQALKDQQAVIRDLEGQVDDLNRKVDQLSGGN